MSKTLITQYILANVHKFQIFRLINFKQNALFPNFEAENKIEIQVEFEVKFKVKRTTVLFFN